MIPFSFSSKRRGAALAGISSMAGVSLVLLCGARTVPIENFSPQGPMQGDLNAGGHSITNAATVSTTNLVVNGTNFTGGSTGPQGPAGTNGTNGLAGATGPTGPAGPTGATGAQGPAGTNGTNGVAGATGPAGPTGPAGTNGAASRAPISRSGAMARSVRRRAERPQRR